MHTRGGGVLSASALAAVGASVLLVSLIGLGLSALADQPRGGGMDEGRREFSGETAAAVYGEVNLRAMASATRPSSPKWATTGTLRLRLSWLRRA